MDRKGWTDRQTDRPTYNTHMPDRQTDRQTDTHIQHTHARQTDRQQTHTHIQHTHASTQTDRQTHTYTHIHAHRHRQTDRQTDTHTCQTDRQTHPHTTHTCQTDRQADRQTHTDYLRHPLKAFVRVDPGICYHLINCYLIRHQPIAKHRRIISKQFVYQNKNNNKTTR